jgi:hypothetical protein
MDAQEFNQNFKPGAIVMVGDKRGSIVAGALTIGGEACVQIEGISGFVSIHKIKSVAEYEAERSANDPTANAPNTPEAKLAKLALKTLDAQVLYFKTRSKDALKQAKALESQLRKAATEACTPKPQPTLGI